MTLRRAKNRLRSTALQGALAASLALLAACGAGGIGGIGIASGGIGGTGFSRGPVTSFGSIVVNDVHFDVSNATFSRDGLPSNVGPGIGEVVTIEGSFDANGTTGKASTVSYRPLVVGPVTQLPNLATHTVEILGQAVQVDARTVLDGFTALANLKAGDRVEVSGLFTADQHIHASLLRLHTTASTQVEVQGTVAALDRSRQRLTIGNLTVDYASLSTQEEASLENGDFIDVHGTLANGVLDADHILSVQRGLQQAQAGDEIELTGYVSARNGSGFTLDGVNVTVTQSTAFEHGTAANLTNDTRIEVEGTVNAAGTLVANEVTFTPNGVIKILAHADSATCGDAACHRGTLTVLGIAVRADAQTVFDEDSGHASLSNIHAGDRLEIDAYQDPQSAAVHAIHVGVAEDAAETEVELTGKVQSKDAAHQQFTVLGVTVHTDHATFDKDGGSAAFYAALSLGTVITAQGTARQAGTTYAVDATDVGSEED